MAAAERERRRYPTWVRVTLVGLQVVGIVGGLALGNATYEAWSDPDEPAVTTTTVPREEPVSPSTLG
jgi:hypothetical protein